MLYLVKTILGILKDPFPGTRPALDLENYYAPVWPGINIASTAASIFPACPRDLFLLRIAYMEAT